MQPDILFTNASHISNDHHERITMRPNPALGPLDVAAYLGEPGYMVDFFDSVIQTNEDALPANDRLLQPRVIEVSALKGLNRMVIAGGPDPSIVPGTYIREFGADYVVMEEGEYTALELLDSLIGRAGFFAYG